jgi:hypothetical protein
MNMDFQASAYEMWKYLEAMHHTEELHHIRMKQILESGLSMNPLQSHLKLLSNKDLAETRSECLFRHVFLDIFREKVDIVVVENIGEEGSWKKVVETL